MILQKKKSYINVLYWYPQNFKLESLNINGETQIIKSEYKQMNQSIKV